MSHHPSASESGLNLDHLEALARAATPGPWAYQEDSDVYTHIVRPVQSPGRIVHHYSQETSGVVEANARFTAGANPAAVLALIALARRAQPEGEAPQAKDTPESMAQSNARFAIDGAIQYGRENRNEPPGTDHWLYEYWNIGRQLAQLGATGWDNVTPAPAASLSPLCGAQHAESGKEAADILRRAAQYFEDFYANAKVRGCASVYEHVRVLGLDARAALAGQQAAAPGALAIEAEKLAPILRGMCEGGDVHGEGVDIYADDYIAGDGDTYVVRAAALLEQIATTSAPGTPEAPADDLYDRAVMLVRARGRASPSLVQRTFLIGYNRASRLIDTMERAGVISPSDKNGHRSVVAAQLDGDQGEGQ